MTWTDPASITTASIWQTNSNGIDYQGGNVGIGTTLPAEALYIKTTDSDLDLETNDGAESSSIHFKKSRGTTTSPTIINSVDYFANIQFMGYDGATYHNGARIEGSVDGTPSVNNMPGKLVFYTNPGTNAEVERMRITSNGNVGIGTTTPSSSQLLHVEGNSFLNGVTSIGGTSGLASTLKVFSGFGVRTAVFFDGTGNESFNIFSSGNIGIGNGPTGAVGILQVQDNNTSTTGAGGSFINIQNTANATGTTAGVRFRTGGSTAVNGDSHYKGAIFFEDENTLNGEGNMIFAMNNTANNSNVTTSDVAMIIESAGDVGIGIANPSSKLHVDVTSIGNAGLFDNHSTTAGTGVRGDVSDNNATASGTRVGVYGTAWYGQSINRGGYFYGYGGTTAQGIFAQGSGGTTNYAGYFSGDIYSTGSYLPSDRVLKDNIKTYEGALSKLKQINIRTYNYKQDGKFKNMQLPKGEQIGFIANELKTIFPQLTKKTLFDINEHDDKGMPIENHTPEYFEFDAVNYTGMVPVLVKAIQEQQTMIEELKQEIEALKNK